MVSVPSAETVVSGFEAEVAAADVVVPSLATGGAGDAPPHPAAAMASAGSAARNATRRANRLALRAIRRLVGQIDTVPSPRRSRVVAISASPPSARSRIASWSATSAARY